jgi:predicted metal-dependent hydrolase
LRVAVDPVAPSLSPEEQGAFERGVAEFNAGRFYECHDTLEELWSGVRGASRDFFQGLIQVAVGFYHLGNGNRVGAERLLGRALRRLDRYPAAYAGLDLGALRSSVAEWRRVLQGEGRAAVPPLDPPRLRAAPARSG